MRIYSTTVIALIWSLFATGVAADPGDPGRLEMPASARRPVRGIALEAHLGAPTAMTAIVGPVLRELERRGYASRPASIVELLGGRAGLPGIVDRGTTADDIAVLSERGCNAFSQAEYKAAVAALALAVEQIKRNPALLVLDAAHTRIAFRAFVSLALSQSKLGTTAESIETMTELIRTFSTHTVSRADYGPFAEQFFRTVQKQTQAMTRGQLAITVDDPRALVFVNGELRGTGKVAVSGLAPGIYRVFIQVPGSEGRQYQVAVRADNTSKLDINWQSESALTISEAWVGFAFASEAEAVREPDHAGALARSWQQDTIIVVDATQIDDKQAVVGTTYRTDGSVVRSALVIPSDDPTRLYALASFLADGTRSDDLRVIATGYHLGVSASEPTVHSDSRAYAPWAFVGGGAVALGLGIVLFVIDQDRGYTDAQGTLPAYYRDTAPFGIAAGIAGAASIAAGLWLRRARGRPQLSSVSLVPSQLVIRWVTRF